MKKLHVFLADDHALMREGLRMLVEAQPDLEVVGEAGDGEEAWRKVKSLQPDIVLMDVSMPRLNGVQATERLRASCPQVKVLALSGYEDEAFLRQLLALGASGYVLKRAVAEELIHAIHTVMTGGTYLDPAIAGKVVGGYVHSTNGPARGDGALSGREAQILRSIAWGHTNKEIAERLGLSIKTVEGYKARLMEKLNLHTRPELVRYALRQGWLQDNEDEPVETR